MQGFGFGSEPALAAAGKEQSQNLQRSAFRQQIELTITQIENIYWDLVNAYQDEQVKERSLAFAENRWMRSRSNWS